ncbi:MULTISPECIES: AAA family ATPase [Metallosphaera]|uniref:AAA family ATPase n=1 Tax=Metallosphaera TaxID=41980 RepID=UPI001F06155C|nr:ATP/GTP-binding protein [Metallosphaera sedula]MCH1770392.1 ATP/GTP-binding protein [Metallosphaera sedula]MCP6727774.1 ATP/GTP-binding protein [Metallosphaera sedula]
MITTIKIKNFKSFRDVTLNLGKISAVVGPNGSGKTNLVDAFSLLKQVLRPSSLSPYPFARWGEYKNVVFMQDPGLDISFELEGKYKGMEYRYFLEINGEHSFTIKREEVRLGDREIERERDAVKIGDKRINIPVNHSVFNLFNALDHGTLDNLFSLSVLESELKDFMLNFFNDVLILRSTENALQPVHVSAPEGIGEDGAGLPRVLLGKPLPDQISDLLNSLNMNLRETVSDDGNVTMFAVEVVNGKEIAIPSTSIPSGVLKMIILLTSIYVLKPSLIIIDGLENSLHLSFMEKLIDILRYSKPQFLITTHSPMVMDFLYPSELVILDRETGETRVTMIQDPQGLKKKLLERGLTLSEWIMY